MSPYRCFSFPFSIQSRNFRVTFQLQRRAPMKRFTVVVAMLLLLIAAIPLAAQEQTSAIQGTITDAAGAALPGVTVEAVNQRGQRFTSVTDSSGSYRMPAV